MKKQVCKDCYYAGFNKCDHIDETEYLKQGENGKKLKESISQLKPKVMETIYSDEGELSSMTITNSTGENVYSHGIWHEKSCPVRVSSGVLKTCICDKTLTKKQK
jgi:hypothetical protein